MTEKVLFGIDDTLQIGMTEKMIEMTEKVLWGMGETLPQSWYYAWGVGREEGGVAVMAAPQ